MVTGGCAGAARGSADLRATAGNCSGVGVPTVGGSGWGGAAGLTAPVSGLAAERAGRRARSTNGFASVMRASPSGLGRRIRSRASGPAAAAGGTAASSRGGLPISAVRTAAGTGVGGGLDAGRRAGAAIAVTAAGLGDGADDPEGGGSAYARSVAA